MGELCFLDRKNRLILRIQLIRYMFGNESLGALPERETSKQAPILEIEGLTISDKKTKQVVVDGATLTVHAGQIVAIAGVAGNGQKHLAEAVAGLSKIDKGSIKLDGIETSNLHAGKIRGSELDTSQKKVPPRGLYQTSP